MRRKARKGGGRQLDVTVEALGGRGDGLAFAELEGGRKIIFLPLVLPGEDLRVRLSGDYGDGFLGEVLEIKSTAENRIDPPCPDFGRCGGCALQHMELQSYRAWKEERVWQLLAREGVEVAEKRPMLSIDPATRRRAIFALEGRAPNVRLGFRGRRSHDVVPLQSCLVLTPALKATYVQLAGLDFASLPVETIFVNMTQSGADIVMRGHGDLGLAARETLAAAAEAGDWARLTWQQGKDDPELVIQRKAPEILLSGLGVQPPPGAFLQPSLEGEAALTALVLEALGQTTGTLADLFCGLGGFALAARPLENVTHLVAIDSDEAAVRALDSAVRRVGLHKLEALVRDLYRNPLSEDELGRFSAVIFDPPRAGAKAQVEALAGSSVAKVVAVSCNPQTFARDAAILVKGGYRLDWAQPLDQFIWSGHVEVVASFSKG